MSTFSKHLNARQVRALEKVGDALCPGYEDLPSFSTLGCVKQVDRVLDYMPAQDLGDLKLLLTLLSVFPRFLIGGLIRLLELSPAIPTPVGALLRFMRLGLRGLSMSLYYSDPRIEKLVGYEVSVFTDDQPQAVRQARANAHAGKCGCSSSSPPGA